jgi:O-antigen/teichoic acid export membrane protein
MGLNIRAILGDSLSGAMVPIIKVIITFVMSPIIVKSLGNYDYGILEITGAVVGYMGILDLGLTPAIIRYVARHKALGDKEELERIYSSAMAFLVPVGLFIAVILLGVAVFVPDIIMKGAGQVDQEKYFIFIIIVAAQAFVTFAGSVFDCFLEGLQQYKLRNYATVIMSIIGALVMYPVLKSGGGLVAVAAVNAAGFTIKYLFYRVVLHSKRLGSFRFSFSHVSSMTLKEMFTFGFNNLVYAVSLRISTVTDSLIIGAFLGPATVTLYIIPYNFVSQVRTLVWAVSRNFMPLFSELDALGENETAQRLYLRFSRLMVGFIFPMVVGIVMLGPSFLEHWMGEAYAKSGAIVLYTIAAAYGIQWLNPLANRLLTGYGQHRIMAKLGLVSSLLNLGISLILVHFFGKEGVAFGTLLAVVIFEPIYLYKVCKIMNMTVWNYAGQVLFPLIVPLIIMTAALQAVCWYRPPSSLLHVMIIALFGAVLYLPAFFMFSISRDERETILRKVALSLKSDS